ncbi:hypothetical protein Tco_0805344 [Tanacetum coccineum]
MDQNYFEPDYSGFDQPPQYSINHQEDLNQQDVHDRWEELLNMIRSFCEKFLQQKQAASIDQSPLQEMSIQDMEDLKQHYLDEMLSLSNDLQIKDYRNEKISTIPLNEIDSQIPPSIAITPILPTLEPDDSLIIRDEHLSNIPKKELDEVIKSSVEDLVPIPSESEDTSESDSDCDLPS